MSHSTTVSFPTTQTSPQTASSNSHLAIIFLLAFAWIVTLVLYFLQHRRIVNQQQRTSQAQVSQPQAPPPTSVTHKIPFVGTYEIPLITSPGPDGDVEAILEYLKRRGTTLGGQAFNSDIFKALTTPWLWTFNRSTNPPVGTFPPGPTHSAYYLVYDTSQRKWNITTRSPFA
jgi:hypothetical protein